MHVNDMDLSDHNQNSLTESLLSSHQEEDAELSSVTPVPPPSSKKENDGGVKGEPITVQATVEEEQEAFVTTGDNTAADDSSSSWDRGETQPSKFRDWGFALLFYVQFITMMVLAFVYGIPTIQKTINAATTITTTDFAEGEMSALRIYTRVGATFAISTVLTLLSLTTMKKLGSAFIKFALYSQVALSFLVAILTFASGGGLWMSGLALLSAIFGLWYAFSVRRRIPFAAANLQTGIKALTLQQETLEGSSTAGCCGGNAGFLVMMGVSYITSIVLMVWTLLWTASLYWILDFQQVCDGSDNYYTDDSCQWKATNPNGSAWMVLFVLCLYWTQQVCKNVVHTTVAGLVGTWYFDPLLSEETTTGEVDMGSPTTTTTTPSTTGGGCTYVTKVVGSSLSRTLTYSFGSVCFGSLLVAIVQTLRFVINMLKASREEDSRNGRRSSGGGSEILFCILDCILQLLERLVEYFNKWAFIYVGLYGYDYISAGKKVMTLFQQRGFNVIINDHLVSNALGLMSFTVGLMAGIFGYFCFSGGIGAFLMGFIIGLLLSSTMMGVVDSAVNTIVVCFAEAPHELERNHRDESHEMKQAWRSVYSVQC